MIKVGSFHGILDIPETKEIWCVTRKELAMSRRSLETLIREKTQRKPVYIYEDESLRAYFVGVN